MKKMKKLVSMLLAGAMALSIGCVGAFAEDNSTKDDSIITRTVTPSTTVHLNKQATTQIIPWSVYSGFGYWKIHVDSTCASPMTIRIFKGSPSGTLVWSDIVWAGESVPFYCDENSPLSTGAYYVTVTSNGYENLSGNLYYKFANSYGELF